MAFDPLNKEARAQWREMLSPADPAHAGFALLLFALSSFVLPLCDKPVVTMLYLLGAVVFYYLLSRSLFAVLIVSLPGVLLFGVSAVGGPLLPGVYAALLLGSVSGAYLVLHILRSKQISFVFSVLLILLAAYGAAFWITGGYVRSLLVLLPLAPAVTLGLCVFTCRAHTPSTILTAAVLVVLSLAVWLTALRYTGGNPLAILSESVRTSVSDLLRQMAALYEEQGLSLGMTDVGISNAAILCANLLPGLLIAACSVLAYLMWRMLLRLLLAWQTLPRLPVRLTALTVSPVCAALFLVCYLVALFANSSTATLFGTVCQNLSVIFEPALALVGCTSLVGRDAERSCLSQLLATGLIVLLFFRPAVALAIAAFVGTFRILTATFLPHNKGGQ